MAWPCPTGIDGEWRAVVCLFVAMTVPAQAGVIVGSGSGKPSPPPFVKKLGQSLLRNSLFSLMFRGPLASNPWLNVLCHARMRARSHARTRALTRACMAILE